MKLINRTFRQTTIWLLPLLIIGSFFVFFMIKYIVYEETDEHLSYEMERIVKYHQLNSDLPEFHKVADIQEGIFHEKPFFKDTMMLEPGDNEMVPHRELHFSIQHKGEHFALVLRHLLPGNDDIFQGSIIIIMGLMLLIFFILLLTINMVSKSIWKPFYQTLNILTGFRINAPFPALPQSQIDEFDTLNKTVSNLLKKVNADYSRTREFNENASHELQTHLAMIRANTEKLMNHSNEESENNQVIANIHEASVQLSQVQKSLLLLSKIGNQEFNKHKIIDLSLQLNHTLDLFSEAIALRGISLTNNIEKCELTMDPGLAEILTNNLIKNAIKHNIDNGFIRLELNSKHLLIENSGLPYEGEPNNLLERFAIGEKGNMGIGLAIVKQICELFNYSITYQINNKTTHVIQIIW